MGRLFGFVSLLATVAVGLYLYSKQAQTVVPVLGSPHSAVEFLAIRNDLIGIANAERRYFASNARYASLEELRANGDQIPARANFAYSVDVGDTAFKVMATYSGSDPKAPRRVSINDAMAIVTE